MGTHSVTSTTPDSGNHALPQPVLSGSDLEEPDEPPSNGSSSSSPTVEEGSVLSERCGGRFGDVEQ